LLSVLMQDRILWRWTITMIRSYADLSQINGFEERFRYLKLGGVVGQATFGHDRHLNQRFYRSVEWRLLRHDIIARDEGCDLGVFGHEIHSELIIHHMNPVIREDVVHQNDNIFDPEYLITTTLRTHNAIHYGDEGLLVKPYVPRRPGDTKLW
jgi:hypothetical protein